MSVVVGIKKDGVIYLGADSQTTRGGTRTSLSNPNNFKIWKVKGVKKIILPPASSHHHVVVYNPKKKITLGNLIYPRMYISSNEQKYGIGGLTQATLFGFEGQISINSGETQDTTTLGTLPGKLLVKCVRKITCYNFPLNTDAVISKNYLVKKLDHPTIMTELQERSATAT